MTKPRTEGDIPTVPCPPMTSQQLADEFFGERRRQRRSPRKAPHALYRCPVLWEQVDHDEDGRWSTEQIMGYGYGWTAQAAEEAAATLAYRPPHCGEYPGVPERLDVPTCTECGQPDFRLTVRLDEALCAACDQGAL